MNEIIKEQNQKDLKKYRIIIAAVFLTSIVIALFVGISSMDTYVTSAKSINIVFDILMPKTIEGTDESGQGEYTYGMVFYREKNKDYNAKEDEPIEAFNYYYKSENGERIDLEKGVYYPAAYWDKNKDVSAVQVYAGFYLKGLERWNAIKKVIKIVAAVLSVALIVFGIYLWYISWRNREIARHNRMIQ